MQANERPARATKSKVSSADNSQWIALVVLGALALLIAIRLGFRGVNAFGVSARIS